MTLCERRSTQRTSITNSTIFHCRVSMQRYLGCVFWVGQYWNNILTCGRKAELRDIVSNTRKYDPGLSQFRHRELHWLDADDRVRFRVCVQVYKCLHNMAPGYLSTLCQPVSSVPDRRHLRLARRGELGFPRVNLATYGGWAFAYAGPTSWNSLPDSLKDINLTPQTSKRHLKTLFLFST